MKELINNIIAFLEAAITATDLSAKLIIKGFDEADPEQVPVRNFPYVAVDDGGERVESETAARTQTRVYSVNIFLAVCTADAQNALDDVLDLSNEVKTEIEKRANRQKDGHIWGVNILPVAGQTQDMRKLYRGRQVTVEYTELEDNYGEF